jgi:hypothetical protein
MLKQTFLAALAGGAIVFLSSALQNALFPVAEPKSLPGQGSILPALRASLPQPGFYFFPGQALSERMSKEERQAAQADYARRFKEGPAGVIAYSPGGREFRFGSRLAVQFLLGLLAALAAAAILAITASSSTYITRLAVVFLLGFFGFVYLEPQYWNWYGFPPAYTLARVFGGICTWTLAGLAMAAIIH